MERVSIGKSKFKEKVLALASANKKLRYVAIELLDYCNYKCPHCYVKDAYHSKLDFDSYKKILDELLAIGCVWLLLTGGEPLLHPDFLEMYKLACQMGFKVTVFTNGSLLTKEHLLLFKQHPPELIEISLYGDSSKNYDTYVRQKGAYSKMDHNIRILVNEGINVKLKSVLTTYSIDMIPQLKEYAAQMGVDIRFDGFIVPRIDGDNSPCTEFRLTASEVVDFQIADNPRFLDAMKRIKESPKTEGNQLYMCDAARSSVFIDAKCTLCACTFARNISVNLRDINMSISRGQTILLQQLHEKRALDPANKCYNCSLRSLCRYCPGQFLLENGSEYTPIEWHCEYAETLINRMEGKLK